MKKAHLIGLCGAGMSAVGYLLKQSGYDVSGSDQGVYPPISEYLEKVGLPCTAGYAPDNIPGDVELIVIGKSTRLTPENNDEVAHAFTHHKGKIKSFPEVLADLSKDKKRIVVAGSYGKSTVTSLLTHCLIEAGLDPGYFIGAVPKNLETSSHLGAGDYFIFEGDEYPSANWDDRAKFIHYDPDIVLITAASHDHLDVYPTLEDFHAPFKALLKRLSDKGGHLVACVDEPEAAKLFDAFDGPKTSYGFSDNADVRIEGVEIGMPSHFTLGGARYETSLLGGTRYETSLLGRHNIQNCAGVAACLIENNIPSNDQLTPAIAGFKGLTRRMDLKSETSALKIYEGFGSSYEKARAAITAMRDHFPDKRLIVVFEPRTFTWRNFEALNQYETAFEGVDRLYFYMPLEPLPDTKRQVSYADIFQKIQQHHDSAETFNTQDYQRIIDGADPGNDVVLMMTSSNFDGALQGLVDYAEEKH